MAEVAERAHRADKQYAERKHGGENHADGGVLTHFVPPRQPADAERGRHPADDGPEREVPALQVSNHHARQDGVRQRVADKGHTAQHHVNAQRGATYADQHHGEERVLHKGVTEGSEDETENRFHSDLTHSQGRKRTRRRRDFASFC